MEITVVGRKMPVTEALRQYAEEKIGSSMKVMDISPLSCEVVLYVEKNPSVALPAVCEATLFTKGHIIRVEEREEDMYAAIDVAAAKILRQMRKYKTRVVEKKHKTTDTVREMPPVDEVGYDELLRELSDDEIVRVKEVEFAPLTEDEALIQIDLLGHDFFAYTDRDTNLVNVLYRRKDGGYGLLRQAE